jgi:micrococcal nuclease
MINKSRANIMMLVSLFVTLMAVTTVASVLLAEERLYGDFNDVTFIRNYDGDTITVCIDSAPDIIGDHMSIRVVNVDTPEIRGKCGKEKLLAKAAKNFVYTLLSEAHQIDLLDMQRGKYFRIVANVSIDGQDLSKILIDKGLAVEYKGGTKNKNWCE